MPLEKRDVVEIRQVGNGYIVMPIQHTGFIVCDNDMFVFQTFEELRRWLEEHFTHRSTEIHVDE